MTSKPAPHKPQTPKPPALKQPAFAFPFLRKAQGNGGASAQFTDEHDIYRLLATSEPSGAYLVSRKGMWHGGIHITEGGAGQALDLDAGLRCIADGVLIAYRANQHYPVSDVAPGDSSAPFQAPYSTGFALVQHEMEFPRGTKLTFYSLYMHLMSNADYDNFPKRQKPAYWSRQWQITQHAQDRPAPGRSGQPADPAQVGLHVRKTPGGSIVGILPQGAGVTIGKTETVHGAMWGQLTDLGGATLYAPEAGGYVAPTAALDGWIYLGAQNGGPVAKESILDSQFDRVIVTTNQTCTANDPQGAGGGIPVKAGGLMGHPGRYDSLSDCSGGTRMAHIEVFCGEGIQQFINAGIIWANANCADESKWRELGLSPEPTILRVNRGTTLYQTHANGQPGRDPKRIDVTQVYQFAALPQDAAHMFMETAPGNDGSKRRWWKVDGVDAQRNPVSGWVREQSFEGGMVTREVAQSWIDFECHDEDHDPTHTIFATTADYVDHALGSDTPGAGSLGKLSPLMGAIYRVLHPTGSGLHAADELCGMGQSVHGGFPWAAFRASRLIPRHESEWANPAKWQELVTAIEERTGSKPGHEEEKKRIAKLVWWDEVAAAIPGFPSSDVYHINPIGLVGNFLPACSCNKDITAEELDLLLPPDVKEKGIFHAAHDTAVRGFDKVKFLELLNQYMHENDMMTCVRKVHFLSQMSHECDELRTNEEYRNKDGSTPSGWNNYHGGSKFHGRGLIQLTHDTNYASYGKFVGDETIASDPDKVSHSIDHTTHSACWYWREGSHWGDINPKADRNDFFAITVAVNGGFNHAADRFVAVNKLAKLFGAERCAKNPGLVFNDYKMEKSSLYGTNFYKSHSNQIKQAVEAVDAKKADI